ncbi:MAG TPA: prephenate dehydrogenase [Planctomycetota bacterium]|nr:prephenate dehydrogenase [Planctomycetota bacterium]
MLFRKVAIVGVGLIGGSFGAALKDRAIAGSITGIGYRSASLEEAKRLGQVDDFTINAPDGVRDADLVVIATPVKLIPEKAREIAAFVPPHCIVTDVGSTKGAVSRQLDEIFSGRARYVGCHPMAGSDKRGAANASKSLFAGALCILTPTPRTDPDALRQIENVWRAVGAQTVALPPDEHDRRVALASHLLHVTAACLVNVQTDGSLKCAASGFADTTRIAASEPQLWRDICLDNAAEIIAGIDRLRDELAAMRTLIEHGDDQRLLEKLDLAGRRRRDWQKPSASQA